MDADADGGDDTWLDACLAIALSAIDRKGLTGIAVRARSGPVRDLWLDCLKELHAGPGPVRTLPVGTDSSRLVGAIDVAATIALGRRVMDTGILAQVHGGVLIMPAAERALTETVSVLAATLDTGTLRIEREGVSAVLPARFMLVALDEGVDDEILPARLRDRLALTVELDAVRRMPGARLAWTMKAIGNARERLAAVTCDDETLAVLSSMGPSLGSGSLRVAVHLTAAARAHAALRGAQSVTPEDAAAACRLVLGREALAQLLSARERQAEAPKPTPQDGQPDEREGAATDTAAARDMVLDALRATIPQGLLDAAVGGARRAAGSSGRAGRESDGSRRGRRIGVTMRRRDAQARMDILATLRAAVPWQTLRRGTARTPGAPLVFSREDFRYVVRREKRGTTAVFAVDASGSAAVARLAETKGAIELLLAECYVRRDQVALIGFRGASAELLLAPTRALARAKRALAALPGGGGTPLASGIRAATELADGLARRGRDVVTVFLTDGRANVGLDGSGGREQAAADVETCARRFRTLALRGIVIDTARQPQCELERLATALDADYVILPRAGAHAISREISARMEG